MRIDHTNTLIRCSALLLGLLVVTPAVAQEKVPGEDRFNELRQPLPVVARYCQDEQDKITLQRLAEDVAPILWPAPREQFLPEYLPRNNGAEEDKRPAVYYRFRELHFIGSKPAGDITESLENSWGTRDFSAILPKTVLDSLYRIDLRYFFYYWSESGTNSHPNDLESAELKLLIRSGFHQPDCREVYLWEAFGAAHGLSLSTNAADLSRGSKGSDTSHLSGWNQRSLMPEWVLDAQPGCKDIRAKETTETRADAPACFYKTVLLVEAGKHASAPDLNEDGTLTPVIDLNSSHLDAWGIKDAFGADSRVSPGFSSEMFVPRTQRDLIVPKASGLNHPVESEKERRRTDVVPSRNEVVCTTEQDFKTITKIWKDVPGRKPGLTAPKPAGLLSEKGFCDGTTRKVTGDLPGPKNALQKSNLYFFSDHGNPYGYAVREGIDVAFRLDGGLGWTWVPPIAISPPIIGGWFAFKINGNLPARMKTFDLLDYPDIPKSVEVLYQISATRTLGWYASGGREWKGKFSWSNNSDPAWELGMKARLPSIKGLYPSLRVGYRFNGVQHIANQRFVMEFGVGVW